MNRLTLKHSIFHGKFWCPKQMEEMVVKTLHNLAQKQPHIAGGQIQEIERNKEINPPSYFKTNSFTSIFQVKIIMINTIKTIKS